MSSDLEIAQKKEPKHIDEIAVQLGIDPSSLDHFGKYKAKLPLEPAKSRQLNPLILVSAISPTPAGEGKTTVSIGLAQALNQLGKLTTVVLREPSLGPIFGIKGGATGGGYSQVIPMEDINLHFTGDFAAIEKAHNLLAALLDNAIHHGTTAVPLDPRTVVWKRVMDMNDRSLRNAIIGLGGTQFGIPRETGFDITAASEVMAILCLAKDRADLKRRLGNILLGLTFTGEPLYVRDIKAHGAMAVLLKDALKPNLVQTLEGTPAIIHGGPFANIAHGANSIIATKTAMATSEITVTEAGFGFDLGAEKFFDIKCKTAGISPSAVVLVATVRALKYHGGSSIRELDKPNLETLAAGIPNLEKHVSNIRKFHDQAVVAINAFQTDTPAEHAIILDACKELNIPAHLCTVWSDGGLGARSLAEELTTMIKNNTASYRSLYNWTDPVRDKIETIALEIYGAKAVDYMPRAKKDLRQIESLGLNELPVCIAKTQKSLSDNPKLLGRPKDFVVTVRNIEIAAGAGFLVPITGDILRLPGLPKSPAAEGMDIDDQGEITGLF